MVCFPGGAVVKNMPAVQETQEMRVRSLGQEDPLQEAMATHSSILAWELPWTEEPGGLQLIGLQKSQHDLATKTTTKGILEIEQGPIGPSTAPRDES